MRKVVQDKVYLYVLRYYILYVKTVFQWRPYRGGSHLPADIYADNQFMKDYLEQQNTFDEEAFIVADSAYSGEENSQIAALDFQKLLDYINSLNNCALKIETA